METLSKEISKYDTQKSFDYFINCKDNYKEWQAFDIFLNETIMKSISIVLKKSSYQHLLDF